MSSTNQTNNYELSQFLGTDKPAWLSDYNSDMSKIDAQMKLNADAATAAGGTASSASTAIGTLANLTTTDKTDLVSAINEVDSHADTAQSTANTANTTAGAANTKVTALEAKFDFTDIRTLTATTNIGSITFQNAKIATNSDQSIAKIYGTINVDLSGTASTNLTITIPNVINAISSPITVTGASLRVNQSTSNAWQSTDIQDYTINADGSITISEQVFSDTGINRNILIACVIFLKDFGD